MGNSNCRNLGIPLPKGPNAVGCSDFMMDHTLGGTFFRLYYPCVADEDAERPEWIPRKEYLYGLADFMKFNRNLSSFKIPAAMNAPYKQNGKCPVIIFSHGLGAFRTLYSAIGVELASQGFIVAAVEHRDESASATFFYEKTEEMEKWMYYRALKPGEAEFPLRNSQVKKRADECIAALERLIEINSGKKMENVLQTKFDWTTLENSMDLCRIAVMGHSFGGATVIEALCKEVKFKGTVHQSFPDFTFLTGSWIGKILKLKGEIDPQVGIDLCNKASLAFLQRHLGIEKDFNQWDHLIEGKDVNLIPGTNFRLISHNTNLHNFVTLFCKIA
uniref:1-alkyl-2-acetylglycerophosphocholine esterase n=1 Tax=Esox lucius TaxID=8010 RepID=A0AAY5KKW9_ESOLU